MFANAAAPFYCEKIFKLMPRCDKCISILRDYFEKLWYFSGINELHLTLQMTSLSVFKT
jgi:hypothetical protein